MENEWVIAISNGRTYIGQLAGTIENDGTILEAMLQPIYDLAIAVQNTPQGVRIQRVARPVLMYGTVDSLRLVFPTLITRSQLSPNDYRELEKMAAAAEEAKKEIRAASIGLTLASSVPAR
jgi:hypothetical protein